jgi:hypothetical protein
MFRFGMESVSILGMSNNENIKGNKMKITIGSEKQIAWANDIKAAFVEGAKLDLANIEAKLEKSIAKRGRDADNKIQNGYAWRIEQLTYFINEQFDKMDNGMRENWNFKMAHHADFWIAYKDLAREVHNQHGGLNLIMKMKRG